MEILNILQIQNKLDLKLFKIKLYIIWQNLLKANNFY